MAAEAPETAVAPKKRARAQAQDEGSPGDMGPRVVIEHW